MNETDQREFVNASIPDTGINTRTRYQIRDIVIDYIKNGIGYGELNEDAEALLCNAMNAADEYFVYLTLKEWYLLETIKGRTGVFPAEDIMPA